MYHKLIALPYLFAAVSAVYLAVPQASSVTSANLGYDHGKGQPLATSFANTYKVSKSIPVIKTVIKSPTFGGYGLGNGQDIGYSSQGYGHGVGYSHDLGYRYVHGLGYDHNLYTHY